MRVFLMFLFSSFCYAEPPSLSQAIQLNVEKYQLANGLTVLLQVDHSVPLVCTQQWFRVGSKDDAPGRTGIAHFFEHMMFKGTEKFSKDTFGQLLTGKGAEFNAFTSNDYTGYYLTGPKDNLKLFLTIESDRMRNLLLDPKDIQAEREVVKEERRSTLENKPEGIIRESLSQLMFQNLPYRWPIIGSMEDLNAQSIEDLRAFYKRFYSPNNAVLVVSGDFDPAEIKMWINDLYGRHPREEIIRPPITAEPEQTKMVEKTIFKNVQSPIVAIGYHAPPADAEDVDALDLIGSILGQGDSSRLHKKLVYQDQSVTSVVAGCQDQVLASKCYIYSYLKPKTLPQVVIKTINAEIKKLIDHPVPLKELEKAKNNFMMELVNELRKVTTRARTLAYNETLFGDYQRLYNDIPRMQSVTPEKLQAVAKKYLRPNLQNIIILMPEKKVRAGSKKEVN